MSQFHFRYWATDRILAAAGIGGTVGSSIGALGGALGIVIGCFVGVFVCGLVGYLTTPKPPQSEVGLPPHISPGEGPQA